MLRLWSRSPSLRIIGKRVLQTIPVLIGVTLITFCLLNLLPGGTCLSILGFGATPRTLHACDIRLGLDHPFFIRYWNWFFAALHGNFGASLTSGEPVSQILKLRFPVTLELVIYAFIMSVFFSVPVALLSARKPHGIVDRLSIALSMFGLSLPGFVFGLLLIFVFAVRLRIFPAVGFVPISSGFFSNIRSMTLPSSTIAFALFCAYTRLLRADMIDQIATEDYIVTARAKGVKGWQILIRHALRNSIFGLITLIGLNLSTLIGGTVLVESIFGLPGLGQQLLQAIGYRDVIVVEAIVSIIAVSVVTMALVTDLLYAVLDPRIRYGPPSS
jgi:peptide/nickel transport system permease protein